MIEDDDISDDEDDDHEDVGFLDLLILFGSFFRVR